MLAGKRAVRVGDQLLREIADLLFISPKTVDTYKSRLMNKLDIKDLPSLIRFAIKHGLSPL